MFGLISLPYEVLQNIVENISFDDAVSLGRTCKGFAFLQNEERICKAIVQVSWWSCGSIIVRFQIFSC
jgi:hypothetical protein